MFIIEVGILIYMRFEYKEETGSFEGVDKVVFVHSSMLKSVSFAGKPLTPRLIRASVAPDGRSLDVEWHIISYSPVLEYKVQYRNTKVSYIFVIISTCMVRVNNKTSSLTFSF
jgi:hypothetical protein